MPWMAPTTSIAMCQNAELFEEPRFPELARISIETQLPEKSGFQPNPVSLPLASLPGTDALSAPAPPSVRAIRGG